MLNPLRNNIKYYSAIYHLSARSIFWHQSKDEREEVPKLWKRTLCIANREREEKGKNIFKKFISNVYTTYCEGEKSLRGNNARSWEASLFHLILNEVLHKLQSLASDFPGESYTLMFTPRKIATRQTQINVYTKGKVENEVSKGHIQVYIYIYSPHPRPSGT